MDPERAEELNQDLKGPCKAKCFLAGEDGVQILKCEYRARHQTGHKANGFTFKHKGVYAVRKAATTDDMLKALVMMWFAKMTKESLNTVELNWLQQTIPKITKPGEVFYVGSIED